MRSIILLFSAGLMVVVGFFSGEDNQAVSKPPHQASVQPTTKTETPVTRNPDAGQSENDDSKTSVVPAIQAAASAPIDEQQAADEAAIRLTVDSFAKAYADGDATAAAAHFASNAEYVDESGTVVEGRAAIEQSFTELFAENPDCRLEMTVDSIRFISAGVAVEDGTTSFTCANHQDCVDSRYTTVHVKTDGRWLAASVRDHAPRDLREHRTQLMQLAWLNGDWVDEGEDSIVNFSCESVENGNFLFRKFAILIGGDEAMSGTQRIGWDPLTKRFRAWIFDSEGGYGEGLWHHHGDNWVLKCTGVTADGEIASSTSIYTIINDHTMTWQSVDSEIGGEHQPDTEVFTIVRRAPDPLSDPEPAVAAGH